MIYWMSERTSRILEEANIGVIGFDPERDADCAAVTLELPDGPRTLWLGNVRGMSSAELDVHFGEEVLSLGLAVRDDRLIAVGNELQMNEMLKLAMSLRATTAFLKRHGCTPVRGHYGQKYHYHSGFFKSPKGVLWYWVSGDDRLPPTILFRRAKNVSDFQGERNQYPSDGAAFDQMIAAREANAAYQSTERTNQMEIEETTDHYLQTVYRIYDGGRRMAEAYLKRDAEVIKAALEKDKEEREREETDFYRR